MNAYQIKDRIDFYNDVTRNARFFLSDYEKAFNDCAKIFIDEAFSPIKEANRQNKGFQYDQSSRDNLFTLIKTATPSVTDGTLVVGRYGSFIPSHINFPTDYYDLISLQVKIGGITDYCRPTEYNKVGPLLDNTYMMPTNKKTYFNEDSTGLVIWRGSTGSVTTATLVYLKKMQQLILGSESQWISAGTTITNGASYIAVEETVQGSTTYVSGTQFTSSATSFTSGVIILASNTQTTDLPDKVQETVCKMASNALLGITSNYNASQFVEKEISKNN